MGGSGSTNRDRTDGKEEAAGADVKMDEGADDTVDETKLGSLRVKDPDAWKGSPTSRPRSALKHGSSSASMAESEASGAGSDRCASGRKMNRKVSFQVQGLGSPLTVQEAEEEAAAAAAGVEGSGGSHGGSHKRAKGSEEFSMKYLVEKFYSKVLQLEPLKPFFDGVDMFKLKYQQEALMLLVFGGHELLEDELPGLSADLRLIHLHLLFEGLNLGHWQLFADTFDQTLDELHQIPADVKQRAKAYMASTRNYFRPIEPHEWPPKVVYRGWTKRSCPFHTSIKRQPDAGEEHAEAESEGGAAHTSPAAPQAEAGAAAAAAAAADDEFTLPGFNSPPLPAAPPALPAGTGADADAGVHDAAAAAAAAPSAPTEGPAAAAPASAGGES